MTRLSLPNGVLRTLYLLQSCIKVKIWAYTHEVFTPKPRCQARKLYKLVFFEVPSDFGHAEGLAGHHQHSNKIHNLGISCSRTFSPISAPFSSFFWAFFDLLISKIMVKIRPKRGSDVKTVSSEVRTRVPRACGSNRAGCLDVSL
jgi:hypothetical protein